MSSETSASQLESGSTAVSRPENKPGASKRRQLFLLFGFVSVAWCTFLLYMMHDIHLAERFALQDNLDFQGADIDSRFGIDSASECSQECERHPSCFAFTYVKSERTCWLKREGYISKSNPNTISGLINATLAEERRRFANETLLADEYLGEDEGEFELDNMDERERRDLADEYGDQIFDEGYEDNVYGMAKVTGEDVERFDDSTTLFGDVLLHSMVRRPGDCKQLCLDDGRCVAWTLDKYQRLCILRLAEAPTVRFSTDYISGSLSAEELGGRYSEWLDETTNNTAIELNRPYSGPPWEPPRSLRAELHDNTDLLGGDLRELRDIDSVESCQAACEQAAPDCSAWTLSKHTGTCWLKNAQYKLVGQNRSAGVISGVLTGMLPANSSAASLGATHR